MAEICSHCDDFDDTMKQGVRRLVMGFSAPVDGRVTICYLRLIVTVHYGTILVLPYDLGYGSIGKAMPAYALQKISLYIVLLVA